MDEKQRKNPRSNRDNTIKGLLLASLAIVLFLLPSMTVPSASAVTGVTTLCSSLPSGGVVGIYPASNGGAFVEDFSTGDIDLCGGGGPATVIAAPPMGASGQYYLGMGAVMTKTQGLVFALMNNVMQGFWLCYGASTSGCTSESAFISLPSTFCKNEAIGICTPQGTALDKSLNLYYVDNNNAKLVECTASSSYTSCTNLGASSALSGSSPVGLYLKGTTFYIADSSCSGKVWKGTRTSLSLIGSVGDALTGITVSTKNPMKSLHVYVTDQGSCKNVAAHVYDVTDKKPLPTPFTSTGTRLGTVDSNLQFTELYPTGSAFLTKDSS